MSDGREQRNATVTQIASSASSTTLASEDRGRVGCCIFNSSTQTLYVKFGTTASATDFTVALTSGAFFEVPVWYANGRIDGIWSSANGYAYVTKVV